MPENGFVTAQPEDPEISDYIAISIPQTGSDGKTRRVVYPVFE
jgi:hypothetical protein